LSGGEICLIFSNPRIKTHWLNLGQWSAQSAQKKHHHSVFPDATPARGPRRGLRFIRGRGARAGNGKRSWRWDRWGQEAAFARGVGGGRVTHSPPVGRGLATPTSPPPPPHWSLWSMGFPHAFLGWDTFFIKSNDTNQIFRSI